VAALDVRDPLACLALVDACGEAALNAPGPEAAIRAIASRYHEALGDRTAHEREGALKAGERQYFVAGGFFITPDGAWHMLVGNVNFPPEQERLMIPIDGGHPGWVVKNRSKLLLRNTDEHGQFRQYLKTSRMGSAIFAPLFWQGEILGQIVMAAQARYTMRNEDLAVLAACSRAAAAAWIAHGGPAWLAATYPPPNPFKVGLDGV
jgi:hypothetical protein